MEIRLILDEKQIIKDAPLMHDDGIDCMSTVPVEQWSSTNTTNAKIIFGITAFF
jgi:hypothetical protein